VPIGALVTFGPSASALLGPGNHGSTFGGNPLACAAALAVLETIERGGLRAHAVAVGEHLHSRIAALGHDAIEGVRGRGLLQAILLKDPVAADLAGRARDAGFIVNPVTPQALRLAPPLVITTEEVDLFVDALPGLLDDALAAQPPTKDNP
jgi:acetylornithine aminotransferase